MASPQLVMRRAEILVGADGRTAVAAERLVARLRSRQLDTVELAGDDPVAAGDRGLAAAAHEHALSAGRPTDDRPDPADLDELALHGAARPGMTTSRQ